MGEHLETFWKEYLVAVLVIVLAGIFMKIDLIVFLRKLTGYAVSTSTATIIVNYSYLFLVVLGPLIVIGMAGYSTYLNRPEQQGNNDLEKVKFASMDHEFHNFPHDDEFMAGLKSGQAMTDAKKELISKRSSNPSELLSYPHVLDHHVLKQHIKNKLMQGHTITEIAEELNQHNWDQEKVNAAHSDLKFNSKEAEIMLGSFITRALIAGNDINTIRQSLVEKGWGTNVVDKVVNTIF